MYRLIFLLTISLSLNGSRSPGSHLPAHAYWNESLGTFAWWGGKITLPLGFIYQVEVGDSFAGRFTSVDGGLIIRHDIGGYAGVWAKRTDSSFTERFKNEARIWTTRQAVTFPDSNCANFFVESPEKAGAVAIANIARSFHPKDISRSDCSWR